MSFHKISGLFIYLYPVFISSSNTGTHYLYVDAYDQSSDNTSALLIVHYKDNCYVLLRSSSLILSGNISLFLIRYNNTNKLLCHYTRNIISRCLISVILSK